MVKRMKHHAPNRVATDNTLPQSEWPDRVIMSVAKSIFSCSYFKGAGG